MKYPIHPIHPYISNGIICFLTFHCAVQVCVAAEGGRVPDVNQVTQETSRFAILTWGPGLLDMGLIGLPPPATLLPPPHQTILTRSQIGFLAFFLPLFFLLSLSLCPHCPSNHSPPSPPLSFLSFSVTAQFRPHARLATDLSARSHLCFSPTLPHNFLRFFESLLFLEIHQHSHDRCRF